MEKEKILARVGDRTITGEDFNIFMSQLDPSTGQYFIKNKLLDQVLDELIYQEMLYLNAKEKGWDKDEEFQKVIRKTEESLLKTYSLGKLFGDIKVTEGEIKDYFEKHNDEFLSPKSVHASHILVDNLEKAQEIKNKIDKGENFEELAKEHSTCPSAQKGGDLGTFYPGQMVPEFDKAVFQMEVGKVSEPVKTQFGYHIIKVNEKNEEKKLTFDQVKGQIENKIRKQKEQKLYMDTMGKLSEKYKVEKHSVEEDA